MKHKIALIASFAYCLSMTLSTLKSSTRVVYYGEKRLGNYWARYWVTTRFIDVLNVQIIILNVNKRVLYRKNNKR